MSGYPDDGHDFLAGWAFSLIAFPFSPNFHGGAFKPLIAFIQHGNSLIHFCVFYLDFYDVCTTSEFDPMVDDGSDIIASSVELSALA